MQNSVLSFIPEDVQVYSLVLFVTNPLMPDSSAEEPFHSRVRSPLAHNGVLFLDELPKFKRTVLEVMRQPMEERFKEAKGIYCNAQMTSRQLRSI